MPMNFGMGNKASSEKACKEFDGCSVAVVFINFLKNLREMLIFH